jgi:endonuclease/exonuclease/phosphatase family metal-dependent hydrolase
MSKLKIISNQSNSNNIFPNDISSLGFLNRNFDILSNKSKKAYKFESEDKHDIIDKLFTNYSNVYIPKLENNTTRIASYNVHDFVTIFKNYEKKRNINNFIQFFNALNADILCLQEIVPISDKNINKNTKVSSLDSYNYKLLNQKMKEIGYKYSALVNNIIGESYFPEKKEYYVLGNGIFSKIPFEKEIFHLTGNRSAILAFFKTKDMNYVVINTHIEYSNPRIFDTEKLKKNTGFEDIRLLQVQQILEICNYATEKYKTKNIFLSGDFNDSYKSKRLFEIFKTFVSLKINKNTNIFSKNTTDFICPSKNTLKNIFVYNYDAIFAPLSDHLPIFLDFCLSSNKELIKKLSVKKKIMEISPPDCLDYVTDFISNSVTKYVQFDFSDTIISQYYLQTKSWYYFPNLSPIFNIKSYDYSSLVDKLININHFYKNYQKIAKHFDGKPIKITKSLEKNRPYIEDMLIQFIKCRPNMKVITVWPAIDFSLHSKEMVKILQENGDLYYEKEIFLNYWEAMSLMFQIYLTTDRNKTIDHLDYNVKQKGWEKNDEKKRVVIIFYEHKKGGEISGSESDFKTKLRSFWKTNEIRPYDILHINDFFQETVDYATIYLNDNSLNLLTKQNIIQLIRNNSYDQLVYINTLKKSLYENFSQSELINFIFLSSIILYVYGLRKFNDIDGFIYPMTIKNKDFNDRYNKLYDVSSNSFLPCVDISYEGSKAYEDYTIKFYDKLGHIFDKIKYEDVVFNPNYHFYFFGLKMHLIEFEIIKRIYRFKPSSWADLVMIRDKLNYPIVFPKIPEKIKYRDNKIEKNRLIDTILCYIKMRYHTYKKKVDIEKMFVDKEITSDIDNKNINKDFNFFKNLIKVQENQKNPQPLQPLKMVPTSNNICSGV